METITIEPVCPVSSSPRNSKEKTEWVSCCFRINQSAAKYFIQINIGNEMQKGGINVNELPDFLKICRINYNLNIIGLMCIPPQNINPIPFFTKMNELAKLHSLLDLSMGMSEDFSTAIECGSTYIRVGSLIFGSRVK